MAEETTRDSVWAGILKRGYAAVFFENWPIWLGGVLIGLLSVITFAWARPWGVAGGLRNWGDWLFYGLGAYSQTPVSPWVSTNSILTLGLLWGAFGSSLLSKQFRIRPAPPFELLKGVVGGSLMGVGAAMAGGCNVGGFFSSISALSLSGFMMMIGLIVGAVLGLKYLYWELEHVSGAGGGGAAGADKGGTNWSAAAPWFGALALLGAVWLAWGYYGHEGLTRVGGLLLCGVGFGVIIQRTRFCFVRGFRDPFMTGEAEVPRGIAIALLISVLGFAALKWNGLRGEDIYVAQAFWAGGLIGGLIFGFGMVVAGGCGSGSVWRAGEGHIKLMIAVVCFALSTSLFKKWIESAEWLDRFVGRRIFLPDYLTYFWTLVLIVFILMVYWVAAVWNEETDAFTLEM